ncbi:MAG TPA: GIY-YIG nuclease family protein [Deltaproteobacteria bacterium]|nr:GIY-YIG nuclease family protein [Deltaproteobacteria bacterium]
MVRCSDNTLYTGITVNLAKRLAEHNSESKGAKYTRARRPVELVYSEPALSRSEATKREMHIKKMTLARKMELIAEKNL